MKLLIEVSRINRFEKGTMKAFMDIRINGALTIKGFRVVEGSKGLFVSPPQHKDKTSGKYYADVLFEKPEYEELQRVCLEAFNAPEEFNASKETAPVSTKRGKGVVISA
jgi:DNA-binding cell septation regulator SpoVG